MEPFSRSEIPDHPHEVDFGEASGRGVIEVVHSVPDILQDRGERRYTDTSANQEDSFVLRKHVSSDTGIKKSGNPR